MPKTFANPQLTKNGELKHLLSIEGLPRSIVNHILDTADKANLHAELALCAHRALYDLLRGIVAAHCVNDYLHSEKPP